MPAPKDTEGRSAEAVAYALMNDVMLAEQRHPAGSGDQATDSKYLLDLYAECLHATTGRRAFPETADADTEADCAGPRLRRL